MYVLYCDICGCPIKDHETLYVLSVRKTTQNSTEEKIETPEDMYELLNKSRAESQAQEICPKCKAVFDKFIKLRASEVKKLHKKIKYLEEDEVNGNC
jgi:ribosomal protein S26